MVPDAYPLSAAGDEVHAPHTVHAHFLGRDVAGEVVEELFLGRLFSHRAPLWDVGKGFEVKKPDLVAAVNRNRR